MATVETIHARPWNRAGWVLFIEGIDVAFTNIVALVGSGVGSWIGTTYGARSVKLGLRLPAELHYGETDPWASKIKSSSPAVITLLDHDGTLVSLFTDVEPDETTDTLGERVGPLDDPAPDPGPGLDGELITLWGRHMGIERIGPTGERRHFWIAPADAPPGLDHVAATGWPATHVTDAAAQWAGRKVAVYRVVQDPDTGTWPSWTDQYEGGSLWWAGTMTDRGEWQTGPDGRAFVFYAHPQASWLERSINLARPTDWYSPTAAVTLTGDELLVAVWIEPVERTWLGDGIGGTVTVYDCHTLRSGDDLTGLSTVTEIWTAIGDIAKATADGNNYGAALGANNAIWVGPVVPSAGTWNNGVHPETQRRIRIAADGSAIGIKCDSDPAAKGFRVGIAADAKVWQLAGWDINGPEFEKVNTSEAPVGGVFWGEAINAEVLPPGHVYATFSTRNEENPGFESTWDNDTLWRDYLAPYPQGCITLDHEGGTEVFLAFGPVRCEGQHGRPFTLGSQIDGVDCDTSGWWLFRGFRLTAAQYLAGEREGVPYVGVALCEWVATPDGDSIEINGEGQAAMRIIKWENPRAFGLPFDRPSEPWVNIVGLLECSPLGVLGGVALGDDAPGWRHRVIVTMLLSTGTSVWDATGDAVTITPGDNHPPAMPALEISGDTEVADLGLGIPDVFVDFQSFATAASQLPGGTNGALNRVLYALYGSAKASEKLREVMAGAGWAWTLGRAAGGGMVPAFGCYDPLRLIQPGDVVATLTRADMAELGVEDGEQWRGTVELRRGGPYDRFDFEVGHPPLDVDADAAEPYKLSMESGDFGRVYRSGRITWPVVDSGLHDPGPFLGGELAPVFDWTGHARQRFASGIGPRLAKQQRIYRGMYNARFAGVLGLGSPVHVIDGTAETPTGVRGVNHRGRVIELSIIARGTGACSVRVAVELERAAVDEVHVWGPYAWAGVGSWDSGTNTLTIAEDHALVGGAHKDTTGWAQPSWSTQAAGAMLVTVYQSEDGESFDSSLTATAEIAAVDAGALTLELANITGTIYRDTIKLVVGQDIDSQTADWAAEIFAPITAGTGLYNGVDKGVRLK